MYVDVFKIFLSFSNIADQVLIQDNINYLTSYCSTNLIKSNVKNVNVCASLDYFYKIDFMQ